MTDGEPAADASMLKKVIIKDNSFGSEKLPLNGTNARDLSQSPPESITPGGGRLRVGRQNYPCRSRTRYALLYVPGVVR
jgi:hypothetical protein